MGRFSNGASAINSFRNAGNQILEGIKAEVEIAGRQTELEAKQNAPVDTGALRGSIFYEKTNNGFGARVTANKVYAPYVEFGTGTSVDVPDGFEDLAIQFKGTGKKQINLKPRPFLIPAAVGQFKELITRLKSKYARR